MFFQDKLPKNCTLLVGIPFLVMSVSLMTSCVMSCDHYGSTCTIHNMPESLTHTRHKTIRIGFDTIGNNRPLTDQQQLLLVALQNHKSYSQNNMSFFYTLCPPLMHTWKFLSHSHLSQNCSKASTLSPQVFSRQVSKKEGAPCWYINILSLLLSCRPRCPNFFCVSQLNFVDQFKEIHPDMIKSVLWCQNIRVWSK